MKLKGGINLEHKKESHYIQWTPKRFRRLPPKVWLPLNWNQELLADPCVNEGARVCIGEKVANPANENSVALHASISGRVSQIGYFPHPLLGESQCIEIESDDLEEKFPGVGEKQKGWESIAHDKLENLFQNAGLVDMRMPGEALHKKMERAKKKFSTTVVINAVETEPYVSCDFSLMMSNPVEILQGAELVRRAIGAERIIVAVGEREREAMELIKSKVFFLKWDHCDVEVVSSLYPQSEDHVLLKTLSEREGKIPVKMDRSLVLNPATTFAAYEAIALRKPLYERSMTIDGECLMGSQNMWIPLGVSFAGIVKANRGFLREPRKVLMGGPMTGVAQTNLDVPVLPMSQALLALPEEIAKPEEVSACIRCGDCIESCPVEISPVMITLASEKDEFSLARDYGVSLCIECGNCAYVCPSKRPMLDLIRYVMEPEPAQAHMV